MKTLNDYRKWLNAATHFGGSFIKSFAQTVLLADKDNFQLLLPVLDKLVEKYPHYNDVE